MRSGSNRRFSVQPVRLSRRATLRGLGITAALPTLEAMLDGRGRWWTGRAYAAAPVRLVTFFFPNGWGAYGGAGARGDEQANLDAMLAAGGVLAPVKDEIVALRSLTKAEHTDSKKTLGDDHDAGHGSFATGVGAIKSGAGGPSVDQHGAAIAGASTRFPSLALAIGRSNNTLLNHISWKGAEQPVPPENDPAKLWTKLFQDGGGAPGGRDYRKPMLDYLGAEARRLQPRLGTGDRARMDEYLTGLGELDRAIRLAGSSASCGKPPAVANPPELSNERAQLLIRLLVLALQCDLTRFASFQLANRKDNRQFPWLGLGEIGGINGGKYELGHHALSHDSTPAGAESLRKIVFDEVAQFVYLVTQLKAAQEPGGGTVLGGSILFCSSEHQNGAHQYNEIPVLLAGQAGGKLKTGRELKYAYKTVPYANALTSLLQLAGVPVEKFGTHATGGLPNL